MSEKVVVIHVSLVMPGIVDADFHMVADTPTAIVAGGRASPMRIESADEVAERIVSLIEHPIAELYTNPSFADLVQQYYRDVGAFEGKMARSASTS